MIHNPRTKFHELFAGKVDFVYVCILRLRARVCFMPAAGAAAVALCRSVALFYFTSAATVAAATTTTTTPLLPPHREQYFRISRFMRSDSHDILAISTILCGIHLVFGGWKNPLTAAILPTCKMAASACRYILIHAHIASRQTTCVRALSWEWKNLVSISLMDDISPCV